MDVAAGGSGRHVWKPRLEATSGSRRRRPPSQALGAGTHPLGAGGPVPAGAPWGLGGGVSQVSYPLSSSRIPHFLFRLVRDPRGILSKPLGSFRASNETAVSASAVSSLSSGRGRHRGVRPRANPGNRPTQSPWDPLTDAAGVGRGQGHGGDTEGLETGVRPGIEHPGAQAGGTHQDGTCSHTGSAPSWRLPGSHAQQVGEDGATGHHVREGRSGLGLRKSICPKPVSNRWVRLEVQWAEADSEFPYSRRSRAGGAGQVGGPTSSSPSSRMTFSNWSCKCPRSLSRWPRVQAP